MKLYLLADIAGTRVAIDSNFIESVVHVGDVVSVPRSDPVIAGLFALRSRVLTLIDCQYRVTGEIKPAEKGGLAVIAAIAGHNFGLLVDGVSDVVPIDKKCVKPAVKLDPNWRSIVVDLAEIDDDMVMIINPELLVAPQQAIAA